MRRVDALGYGYDEAKLKSARGVRARIDAYGIAETLANRIPGQEEYVGGLPALAIAKRRPASVASGAAAASEGGRRNGGVDYAAFVAIATMGLLTPS